MKQAVRGGNIYRSLNGGNSYSGLPRPSPGQWVTPLAIHPTNENILYGGWTGVYRSINGGTSWTNISGTSIAGTLADMAVAPSNPNYIYASNGSNLWVTTNDGATWTARSAPSTINDIAVDPLDPTKIWIACNSTVNRVLVSTNAGASFTNISANLPSIVARTVVVDDNIPRGIYVGMNIGVFYTDESVATWTDYSDNLPLVAINELEIQKQAGKIRVATYGRGIWESPVVNAAGGFSFSSPSPVTSACPAPASLSISLGTIPTGTFSNPITLSATAGVPAGTNISFSQNPVNPGNPSIVTLNNANGLAAGTYTITITGTATSASTQTRDIIFIINSGAGPLINTQPASQTVCPGNNAIFTVSATGAITYQWQISPDCITWANLINAGLYSGVQTASLTITGVSAPMNGMNYRVLVVGQCGTTNSTACATLTIGNPPSIITNPVNATVCAGSSHSFNSTAFGTGLSYQWQVSTDGGITYNNINGANGASYTIASVSVAMNNNRYRVLVNGTCAPGISSGSALLNVISPIVITAGPVNAQVCSESNTGFSVAVTGTNIIYQWQVSTDGGMNYSAIGGANTASLSLTAVNPGLNNNRYRVILSTALCSGNTISNAAVLTVHQLPSIGLTSSLNNLMPGQVSVLTALPSASTGGTVTVSWYFNGTLFSNPGNTYNVNVSNLGNYQVRIQEAWVDGSNCSNQSSILTIGALPSSRLFIFPSPNDGRFLVAYYNNDGAMKTRNVRVYDARGALVYNKQFTVSGPYTLMGVTIAPTQKGIYYVVVGDAGGNKIADGRVIVH